MYTEVPKRSLTRTKYCLIIISLSIGGLAQATEKSPPSSSNDHDQNNGQEEVTLEETVVTGQEEEEQRPTVQTQNRATIEQEKSQNAAAAFRLEPAINIGSGRRNEAGITLRGFDQRHILILMDGVPAYIPYEGKVDLSTIPSEMIESLNLIKGPASIIYGPTSLGGAINIFTRAPGTGPLISAMAEMGRGSALLANGFHALKIGPLGYSLYGGLRRRESYPLSSSFVPLYNYDHTTREDGDWRENSDTSFYHAGGNFRLKLHSNHEISAMTNFIKGEKGIPPGLLDPAARYWRFSDWQSINITVGHHASYLKQALVSDATVYLRLYDNLLDSYDDKSYTSQTSTGAFHSWYHDQLFGGRILTQYHLPTYSWGSTDIRLWLGGQEDRHTADNADKDTAMSRTILTIIPEFEFFLGEHWSLMGSCQTEWEIPGPAFPEEYSVHSGIGPLFAVRYDLNKKLLINSTIAHKTRFATLQDRFSQTPGTRLANPNLQPESAWHASVEATFHVTDSLRVQGVIYDAEVSDLIELVTLSGGEQQVQNIAKARLLGTELQLNYHPFHWIRFRAGYSYLYARRSSSIADYSTELLSYRPAQKYSLAIAITPRPWIELFSGLRAVGSQDYLHPATNTWQKLDPYFIWEANLTFHPWSGSSLWVRMDNILDANYQSEAGYPEPGREIWVGLRIAYDNPHYH